MKRSLVRIRFPRLLYPPEKALHAYCLVPRIGPKALGPQVAHMRIAFLGHVKRRRKKRKKKKDKYLSSKKVNCLKIILQLSGNQIGCKEGRG